MTNQDPSPVGGTMVQPPAQAPVQAPRTPIACRALATDIAAAGLPHRMLAPTLRPDDTVLYGRFRLLRLGSGLSLHATDAVDAHDLTSQAVSNPGLTVALFLRGRAEVSLGGRPYRVAACGTPQVFVLSRAEPDLFVRRGMRGNWVRKATISVPPDWFDDDRLGRDARLRAFARAHGASAVWEASARQVQLAERMIGPTPYAAALEGLYLESHALEIVAESLSALTGHAAAGAASAPAGRAPAGRDRARVQAVCDYLDAHTAEGHADAPRLEDVARHAGMSVSALQRLFRAAHGTSVFDYYRGLRMDRARALLERERVSVTEAAYIAGYGNPANFATAFKRRFGLSPRDVRGRR